MTFKLLAKGQTILVRHRHSNWAFLSRYWMLVQVVAGGCRGGGGGSSQMPVTLKIFRAVNKGEVPNVSALKELLLLTRQNSTYSLLHSVSVKRKKKDVFCAATGALEKKHCILQMMQLHSDIQVKGFTVLRASDRNWNP